MKRTTIKRILVSIAFFSFFLFVLPAHASVSDWDWDFDSYTVGDLNGQGPWHAYPDTTSWDVTTAQHFGGPNSLTYSHSGNSSQASTTNTLTDLLGYSSFVVRFNVYMSAITSGSQSLRVELFDNWNPYKSPCYAEFTQKGVFNVDGQTTASTTGYYGSAGTWYPMAFEIDVANQRCRLTANYRTTDWVAWQASSIPTTLKAMLITMPNPANGQGYIDEISVDPGSLYSDGSVSSGGSSASTTRVTGYTLPFVTNGTSTIAEYEASLLPTSSSTVNFRVTYVNLDNFGFYRVTMRHLRTGEYHQFYGTLTSSLENATQDYSYTFDTPGGWRVETDICDYNVLGYYACTNRDAVMQLNVLSSDGGLQETVHTPGLASVVYPTSSCAFSLNPFASTEFSWSDCMGYLFTPGTSSISAIRDVSLANSFPFAYVYDLAGMARALFYSTSTASSSVVVSAGAFGDVTFISKSMIAAIPFVPYLKIIMIAFLYFATARTVYAKVMGIHGENIKDAMTV